MGPISICHFNKDRYKNKNKNEKKNIYKRTL